MVVGSTRIEFWLSDRLLAVVKFEFLRQNLSLPRVNNFWPLDQKNKTHKAVDISTIYVDISVVLVYFLHFSQTCIFMSDLCRIYR